MKLSPKDWAQALYEATRTLSDKEAAVRISRFAKSLIAQGLGSLLPAVADALPAAANAADGIEEVLVESAHELSPRNVEEILRAAGIDYRKAAVNRHVVPELIAGVRIKRRDSVIDASARRLLAGIRSGARSADNE